MDTFVNVLTEVSDCYVPSTILTVKCPTVRWNRFCQRTYQRKLQAWSRCDWPAYHICVLAAKWAGIALHHYRRSLLDKLQSGTNDRMWWSFIRNISGLCKFHTRSAPDLDILASYFAGKLSLSADFDPTLSTVPQKSPM